MYDKVKFILIFIPVFILEFYLPACYYFSKIVKLLM